MRHTSVCAALAATLLCAEHAQQLGGASPLSSLMVVKDSVMRYKFAYEIYVLVPIDALSR